VRRATHRVAACPWLSSALTRVHPDVEKEVEPDVLDDILESLVDFSRSSDSTVRLGLDGRFQTMLVRLANEFRSKRGLGMSGCEEVPAVDNLPTSEPLGSDSSRSYCETLCFEARSDVHPAKHSELDETREEPWPNYSDLLQGKPSTIHSTGFDGSLLAGIDAPVWFCPDADEGCATGAYDRLGLDLCSGGTGLALEQEPPVYSKVLEVGSQWQMNSSCT